MFFYLLFLHFWTFHFKEIDVNSNSDYSKQFQYFSSLLNESKFSKTLGKVKYETKGLDFGKNLTFSFADKNNFFYGIGPHQPNSFYYQSKRIQLYKFNYIAEPGVVPTKNIRYSDNVHNNIMDENGFLCNYTIKNVKYITTLVQGKSNYVKILNYLYAIFGLDDQNNLFQIIDYNNDKLLLSTVSNVFVAVDQTLNIPILVIINVNKIVTCYKISYDSKFLVSSLSQIFSLQLSSQNIYDIQIDNNLLFFSHERGINVINITQSNSQPELFTSTTDIVSFVILQKSIYALKKNSGLYIYNKKDKTQAPITLPYQFGKKLEYYVHPITGGKFVGIFSPQSDIDHSEYYIELQILDDEYHPLINKVFSQNTEEGAVTSYLTNDYFFIYFLDTGLNRIYSVRKAIQHEVPTIGYIIDLNNTLSSTSKIFPIITTESNTSIIKPIVQVSGNDYISLDNFNYEHPEMKCSFMSQGFYMMIFRISKEVCTEVIENAATMSFCDVYTQVSFEVVGDYNNSSTNVLIVVLVIIICVLIGVGVYGASYNSWLKENKMKLIKIDKNDRKAIYLTEENNLIPSFEKSSRRLSECGNSNVEFFNDGKFDESQKGEAIDEKYDRQKKDYTFSKFRKEYSGTNTRESVGYSMSNPTTLQVNKREREEKTSSNSEI